LAGRSGKKRAENGREDENLCLSDKGQECATRGDLVLWAMASVNWDETGTEFALGFSTPTKVAGVGAPLNQSRVRVIFVDEVLGPPLPDAESSPLNPWIDKAVLGVSLSPADMQ
jgi:hypothetical protein